MIKLLRIRSSFLEREDSYLWKLFEEIQMIIGGNVFEGRMWISSREIILSPYRMDKPVKKVLIRDITSSQENGNYVILHCSKSFTIHQSTDEITSEENVEVGILNIKPFLFVLKILQKLQYDPVELLKQIEEYENSFPCPMKMFGEPVVDKSKAVFIQNDLRFSVQLFHSPYSIFIRPFVNGKVIRVPLEKMDYIIRSRSHTEIDDLDSSFSQFNEDSGNSLIFVSPLQEFNFQLLFCLSSRCEVVYKDYIPSSKKCDDISEFAEKWKLREISNREFVVHLNRIAGRTFHQSKARLLFPPILKDVTKMICVGEKEEDIEGESVFKKSRGCGGDDNDNDNRKVVEEEEEDKKKSDDDTFFPYGFQRMIFCPWDDFFGKKERKNLPSWCNGSLNLFLETTRSILEGRVMSDSLHIWVRKTFDFEAAKRNPPLFVTPREQLLEDQLGSLKKEVSTLNRNVLSQSEEVARREVKFRETKQEFRKVLIEKTEEIQGLNDVNLEILEMVKRTSSAQDRVRKFVNMKQEKLKKLRDRYHCRTNYVDHLSTKIKQLKERERHHNITLRDESRKRREAERRAREWERRAREWEDRIQEVRAKQEKLIEHRTERVMKMVSKREEELSQLRYRLQNGDHENQGLRQELRRALLNLTKIERKVQETEGLREKIGLFGPNPFGFQNNNGAMEKLLFRKAPPSLKKKKFGRKKDGGGREKTRKVMKKRWKKLCGNSNVYGGVKKRRN